MRGSPSGLPAGFCPAFGAAPDSSSGNETGGTACPTYARLLQLLQLLLYLLRVLRISRQLQILFISIPRCLPPVPFLFGLAQAQPRIRIPFIPLCRIAKPVRGRTVIALLEIKLARLNGFLRFHRIEAVFLPGGQSGIFVRGQIRIRRLRVLLGFGRRRLRSGCRGRGVFIRRKRLCLLRGTRLRSGRLLDHRRRQQHGSKPE